MLTFVGSAVSITQGTLNLNQRRKETMKHLSVLILALATTLPVLAQKPPSTPPAKATPPPVAVRAAEAPAAPAPTPNRLPPVPSISDADRANFFKAQLIMTNAIAQLNKDCGDFVLTMDQRSGDPVCIPKTPAQVQTPPAVPKTK